MIKKKKRTRTQTDNIPESLKVYKLHGYDFSWSEGKTHAVGICPSCEKRKFSIEVDTGRFKCLTCDIKGNKYTFLRLWHGLLLSVRTTSDIKKIIKLRDNIHSVDVIKQAQLCFNQQGEVLIPVQKPGGKQLVDLRRWKPGKATYSSPGCSSLYFFQWNEEAETVYICEGDFDPLSLKVLLDRAKHDEVCSIVSVPGAGMWKDGWEDWFEGKDVILLYDNDKDRKRNNSNETFNPGKDGMQRATGFLKKTARSIRTINWSKIPGYDTMKDGFDISDLVSRAIEEKRSKKYLKYIFSSLDEQQFHSTRTSDQIKPIKRTSFEEVVADWRDVYEFSQSFEDILAVCFATVISLFMGDRKNPLWMFIVAPSSSGKTTIIEGFKAAVKHTEYLSELTPASLVTGIRHDDDNDPSLLETGNNKVWFIEDFTPLLSMSGRDEVFGILRAVYNGFYDAHFATVVKRYENRNIGIVSGVTHAIENVNLTDLGERFLRIRLLDGDFNEDRHIEIALNNVGIGQDKLDKLKAGVVGFVDHLIDTNLSPEYDPEMNKKLAALAKFTALMRTKITKDRESGILNRAQPEVASRIATQLKKLGIALARVYGRPKVEEECYRVMQKVAYDSCVGWQLEVIQILNKFKSGITLKTLAEKMNVHINQVRKIAELALATGAIELDMVSNNSGYGGKSTIHYTVSQKIKTLIKEGDLQFEKVNKAHSTRAKRSRQRSRT